jgi:SAM-dependent methyltransferase
MLELVKATRVIGFRELRRLRSAQQLVWPNMLNGFVLTRAVQALLNIGFFDELQKAGRINVAAFAAAHDVDEAVLNSLCDALFAANILDKAGDDYSLSEQGHLLIDVGRGWFTGVYGYEPVYHDLEKLLKKERHYGVDVQRLSAPVAKGSGEIEGLIYFPLAVDIIARGGYRHVLDLGCGDGTFLRHACNGVPGLRGSGIDLAPEAIADAERLARENGLADRLNFVAQDVTAVAETPAPLKTVDVATTFFVLHEILHRGEDAVVTFLKGFRRMFPRVPLIIFEVDRQTPEQMRERAPSMAISYFLQHDLSHQKPVPRHVWPPLLRAAGFERIEERNLGFARTVIFIVS